MTAATTTVTATGHVVPTTATALITTANMTTTVRRGFRSRLRPAYQTPTSPQAPHISRIGPISALLIPLVSNTKLMKVYSVNWPRNANVLDAATAASARRPVRSEPLELRSLLTRGSSLVTKANVRIDHPASTANAARHPRAVPSDVDNGTPRTNPVEAPLAT